jgi:hypothetical protein
LCVTPNLPPSNKKLGNFHLDDEVKVVSERANVPPGLGKARVSVLLEEI